MATYWTMFVVPALAALLRWRRELPDPSWYRSTGWLLVWLTLTLLIGLRHNVGGDWSSYLLHYEMVVGESLAYAISTNDPAYGVLNWISTKFGFGIYGVNLVCGGLFATGLLIFAQQQPRPWLALSVAIPYLVMVVAMGYSRQGVAIGLSMIGLAALGQKSNLRFVAWVAVAALFHRSAVILIPLVILASNRGRWWTTVWVGATAAVLYVLLLQNSTDALLENYIEAQYSSEGGAIRVGMNAVPALIFLAFRHRFTLDSYTRGLWTWVSLLAVGFVVLLFVSPSSTAVDRVALYLIPIQIFVFSRLPDVFKLRGGRAGIVLAIVGYYAAVQFVWLTFASHAFAWVPYRFFPLEVL